MTHFKKFQERHGLPKQSCVVPATTINNYQSLLPNLLIDEWKEFGWCSYAKGLIWLVNPDDFKDILEEWKIDFESSFVFARTSFGDMLLWDTERVKYISVLYKDIFNLSESLSVIFDITLCDQNYLEDVLDIKLHNEAVKKLGILEYDQCYAFEPALALGGSGNIETIRKAKLREYLYLLSQL